MIRHSNSLYRNLSTDIEDMIKSGTFSPGEKLPSIRKMSKIKNVSTTTVICAYIELEMKELIESKPGSGFYVRSSDGRHPTIDPYLFASPDLGDVISTHKNLGLYNSNKTTLQLSRIHQDKTSIPYSDVNAYFRKVPTSYPQYLSTLFHSPGSPRLLEQISKTYRYSNINIYSNEIVVTSGIVNSVFLALSVITKPGDTVAIQSPMNFEVISILKLLKLNPVDIALSNESDFDLLRNRIQNEKVKALIYSPGLGTVDKPSLSESKKEQLVFLLENCHIPIIEIDFFNEALFQDNGSKLLKSFDRTDNVILCSSIETTLSSALQIGWIISRKFRENIIELQLVSAPSISTISQIIVAEYLANNKYECHLNELRLSAQKSTRIAIETIKNNFPLGTKVYAPQCGFFIWIELPDHLDIESFASSALDNNIAILPGNKFTTSSKFSNFIPIVTLTWSAAIQDGITTLGRLAKTLLGPQKKYCIPRHIVTTGNKSVLAG